RKPERFAAAATLAEQAGQTVVRRTAMRIGASEAPASGTQVATEALPGVLVLDTIGELAALYEVADVVFVGGALEPSGGHNPLEPAAFGKAPVFGPSMENFREMAGSLLRAEAAIQVKSAAELASAWMELLRNEGRRTRMGAAAQQILQGNRGATA